MTNIIKLPLPERPAQNIQALFLATEPPPAQKRALLDLGFQAFDHHVYAICPKELTREECQQLLNNTRRPLVAVDPSPVKTYEEFLEWLDE